MTDEQIIKALEYCQTVCKECPFKKYQEECAIELNKRTIELVKRQKAEVERLQKLNDEIIDKLKCMTEENHKLACDKHENEIRVIKEFAERLKEKYKCYDTNVGVIGKMALYKDIDNLLEEMVGD